MSVFYKHWYRKGINKIAHVMDDSKKFLSFENFQAKFPELTCNYLEYQGIVSAIKHSKCFMEFRGKDAINYILQQNKVSKTAYPYIVKNCTEFPAKCTQAWQATFPDKTFQWQLIFSLVFKITFHTKLQAFQFKFLHRIIYKISRLFKIKLEDSPICSFCHNAEEALVHLFCECPVSKSFWNEICSWYSCISKSTSIIHSFDICFGHNVHTKPEIILNHLILLAKFYIYQCKTAALNLNMTGYVNIIKHTLKVEKGIALKKDKLDPFIKKWKNLLFLDS